MSLRYSAIAVDLDGTLLNDSKEITQRQADALERYRARGGKVIIATTHSPGFERYLTAPGNFAYDAQVLCSGALVKDGAETVAIHCIPGDVTAGILRDLSSLGPCRFCATDTSGDSFVNFDSLTFWPRNRKLPLREDFSYPSIKS